MKKDGIDPLGSSKHSQKLYFRTLCFFWRIISHLVPLKSSTSQAAQNSKAGLSPLHQRPSRCPSARPLSNNQSSLPARTEDGTSAGTPQLS